MIAVCEPGMVLQLQQGFCYMCCVPILTKQQLMSCVVDNAAEMEANHFFPLQRTPILSDNYSGHHVRSWPLDEGYCCKPQHQLSLSRHATSAGCARIDQQPQFTMQLVDCHCMYALNISTGETDGDS